jgi:two-component system cell cycle sensor histidine kinase/response regulator CckA
MLERLGYTVTGKASSKQALELFQSTPAMFDLVITDMTMPIILGTELAGSNNIFFIKGQIIYNFSQLKIAGEKLKGFINRMTTPAGITIDGEFRYWQERLLLFFVFAGTFLGPFVYIASVLLCIKEGRWGVVMIDTVIYSWLVALFFFRPFSFRVRAISICVICYILGMILFLAIGPFSSSPVWLFAFPVIVAILLGLRFSLISLAINAGTLIIIGILLQLGHIDWDHATNNSVKNWVVVGLNFMFLNSITTIAIAFISEGIQDLLKRQKSMLTSLKKSEEKYRILGENADDAILIILDGVIKYLNQKTESLTGYLADKLMGKPFADLLHPDDKQTVVQRYNGLLKGEKVITTYSFKVIQQSGIEKTVHLNTVLMQWENKPATLIFLRDITQQIKVEEQLRQSQKMESIGKLAGGIAHDFNNVLYPIIGFTQMSMEDLPKNHPVQENLQDILAGAKRARDLVKQILLFSRQKEQVLKPLILKPIIEENIKLLRSTIPANIDIETKLCDSENYVLCDETEIHEIIMNLCTNAYHSMELKGGKIKVRLNKTQPDPDLYLPSGEYLCLSVSDTGMGIPNEIKNKIFEPYYTTKGVGKGSGLGLSVVQGIVKNYNGEIKVESRLEKGTTFKIFLPIKTKTIDSEQEQEKENQLHGTEKILFVDDEKSIVKLGIKSLERLGYKVTGVKESSEALVLFKASPKSFDLVITDMAMPGMEGTQLAQKIFEIRPDIPIILCSGFSEKIDHEKAFQFNIKAVIDKPMLVNELANKVRELLDQSNGDKNA